MTVVRAYRVTGTPAEPLVVRGPAGPTGPTGPAGGVDTVVGESGDVTGTQILADTDVSDALAAKAATADLGDLGRPGRGTTTGTVAAGDDSRLSDARTPTAHAASHAAAGGDPVTLAQSQVTDLATDLANRPTTTTATGIAAGLAIALGA